jgi:hypothetical protein
LYIKFDDGSEEWRSWGEGVDYWEHAWAVSQGPFYPLPSLQLKGAKMVVDTWSQHSKVGFCPWNVLLKKLTEYGLSSKEYRDLLDDQVKDALEVTEKYPMPGALTEYQNDKNGWRGLPFSAGSFINSTTSQLLQSQAQGLTVRGGLNTSSISDFRYRLSRIHVVADGSVEGVVSYTINGSRISKCLQLPESLLVAGANELNIDRGVPVSACRIYGSDAELLSWQENQGFAEGVFFSHVKMQISIQNINLANVSVHDTDGNSIDVIKEELAETDICLLNIEPGKVVVKIDD